MTHSSNVLFYQLTELMLSIPSNLDLLLKLSIVKYVLPTLMTKLMLTRAPDLKIERLQPC